MKQYRFFEPQTLPPPAGQHWSLVEQILFYYYFSEIRSANVFKGVNTFVYSSRANIIATGGADKIIRIWHPHIFTRPTGKPRTNYIS